MHRKKVTLTPLSQFDYCLQAFANPEDLPKGVTEVNKDNDEVARIRRAHMNDIENILPFLTIGLLYTLTNPSAMIAIMLFRIFAAVRLLHTVVYAIYPIRQPARAICFFIGYLITLYMTVICIICFW